MILSFNNTTLATQFLGLTQCFAEHFQLFLIFEACGIPEVSITLNTMNTIIVLDAGRNGRASIARCVALVLRASPATLVTRGAHVSFGHSRRQVRDEVIMLVVIEEV